MIAALLSIWDTDRNKGWLNLRPWCHLRLLPFALIHVGAVAALYLGAAPVAVLVAIVLYVLRMFAITAFYHRYFSHRAFHTSRLVQFLGAVLGNCAAQRGPLWWAAHHRHHHRHSDQECDTHSPVTGSLWHSHVGWIGKPDNYYTDHNQVRDWHRYPELVWLNRYDSLAPLALAAACFALGAGFAHWWPSLGTSGMEMLLWGFCLSTVATYHATFTINSLAHRWGHRRFATADHSRNNWLLSLITMGEGWHNNHHRFPSSARQGFYWWQLDLSYLTLRGMAALGLVWNLRQVPLRVLDEGRAQGSVP